MRALGLILAALVVLGCSVQPSPLLSPPPEEPATGAASADFVYYFGGQQVGWARAQLSRAEWAGAQAVVNKAQYWLCMYGIGSSVIRERWIEDWRTVGGADIRTVLTHDKAGQSRRVEATWGETIRFVDAIGSAAPVVKEVTPTRPVYSDHGAFQAIKTARLNPGDKLEFQIVNLDECDLDDVVWVVMGATSRRLTSGGVVSGLGVCVVRGEEARDLAIFDGDGDLLFFDGAEGYTLERVDRIPRPFAVYPLVGLSQVPTTLSITDVAGLRELEIQFALDNPFTNTGEALIESNAYQDVRRFERGYALRLKAQHPTEAMLKVAYPLAQVPEDVRLYLQPSKLCESDDADLASEAKRMMNGRKTTVAAVAELSTFVRTRMTRDNSSQEGMASAKRAYTEWRGDCTEHAALLVALARAAGIPARICIGLIYCAPLAQSFGWHAWAEVWIDDWISMDPTRTDFGTSARYLMVECLGPDDELRQARMAKLLRAKSIIINGYRLEDGSKWLRADGVSYFPERK